MLPQELGCGSGMTCWRRLHDWEAAGIWQLITLHCSTGSLASVRLTGQEPWSTAAPYARFLGGAQTGPSPTDRAKLGSRRHLICDGRGVPLAIQLTGANRNDSQQGLALVDAIPFLQGERGRPRRRPDCVLGDRGYDAEAIRQGLRARHIIPLLAMRNTKHGVDWADGGEVVERTFAWLYQLRRLRVATKGEPIYMKHSCRSGVL